MRSIIELSGDLNKFGEKVVENVKQAQRDTAEKIWEDVIELAPYKNGDYISSIQISDTELKNDIITTHIYTDLQSEDGYYIGRMIEYGTGIYALQPHIGHTKTFLLSQYQFWYVPATSVDRPIGKKIIIDGKEFYVAKPQVAKPHFIPALQKNISLYHDNIRKAVKEAKS